MTKPKSRTISGPFDARHVGGVSVTGAAIPMVGIERSSTTLEPDTTPSHTFVALGNIEVPRRSNTITSSLGRPSLRLKTSISLFRGRSSSNSPDRRVAVQQTTEATDGNPHSEMSAHSLRKKTSTSRFWQKAHQESPVVGSLQEDVEAKDVPPEPVQKDSPVLRTKPSYSLMPKINSHTYQSLPAPPPPPPPPPPVDAETRPPPPQKTPMQKSPPAVRPKRADSGTAIDLNDVPPEERPLGFREILAVSSFAERMSLYKKTRDYWAHADHGLNEWVDKAGPRLTFQV